jgi:hypothetical protein
MSAIMCALAQDSIVFYRCRRIRGSSNHSAPMSHIAKAAIMPPTNLRPMLSPLNMTYTTIKTITQKAVKTHRLASKEAVSHHFDIFCHFSLMADLSSLRHWPRLKIENEKVKISVPKSGQRLRFPIVKEPVYQRYTLKDLGENLSVDSLYPQRNRVLILYHKYINQFN